MLAVSELPNSWLSKDVYLYPSILKNAGLVFDVLATR